MKVGQNILSLLLMVGVISLSTGCSSFGRKMKDLFSGSSSSPTRSQPHASGPSTKFSQTENYNAPQDEKLYRRVNRDIFEKESVLDDHAGSLWVMEGQGSYLFSQNMNRVTGDVINISLDGPPKAQLEKKVEIIKYLLDRTRRQRQIASAQQKAAAEAKKEEKPADPKAQNAVKTQQDAVEKEEEQAEKNSVFDVSTVPSRIIDQLPDGSYRVKGSQSFMVGRNEYKVIATGLVRPADVKDESILATKVYDSKFDIVGIRKETK